MGEGDARKTPFRKGGGGQLTGALVQSRKEGKMKELKTVSGPRDCSVTDIMLRIARLNHARDRDGEILADATLSYTTRSMAYKRLQRTEELIAGWEGVMHDVEQSEKKERRIKRVSKKKPLKRAVRAVLSTVAR